MENICNLIVEIQSGNNDSLLSMLEKFDPLLKKASYKLNWEDAFEEFRVYFISLLKNIDITNFRNKSDPAFCLYFKRSIYNYLIVCTKKKENLEKANFIDDLSIYDTRFFECQNSCSDTYDELLIADLRKTLNELEFQIVIALYFDNLSVVQIADNLNISRQSVNSTKLKALKKMRISL